MSFPEYMFPNLHVFRTSISLISSVFLIIIPNLVRVLLTTSIPTPEGCILGPEVKGLGKSTIRDWCIRGTCIREKDVVPEGLLTFDSGGQHLFLDLSLF